MILKIKNWCEEIIVVIILSIIIEGLIPNGNNKKYIKVIIGIYIMYVTINPILNFINYDFDIEDTIMDKFKTVEVNSDFESIKDIYIDGIKECLKNEIISMGYDLRYIDIKLDEEYENIERIEIKINELDDAEIIKQYISENYAINKENIIFE